MVNSYQLAGFTSQTVSKLIELCSQNLKKPPSDGDYQPFGMNCAVERQVGFSNHVFYSQTVLPCKRHQSWTQLCFDEFRPKIRDGSSSPPLLKNVMILF